MELSLGDVARRLRAEKAPSAASAHVFTNDNLPKGSGGLSIVGPAPAEEKSDVEGAHEKHGAAYYRNRMGSLRTVLATHEGELEVLKQKLGENQVQYYPDPNDTLRQEYSRSDIQRLTDAIDQKKAQVETDRQAISDLQDQLYREGGDARWLQVPEAAETAAPPKPDLTGVAKGSQEYWGLRFKAARQALNQAEERQKLAENELALIESQQAHDIGTSAAPAEASQAADKRAEVTSKQAATAEARQELDSLDREFKASDAPSAWSLGEEATPGSPAPL